MGVTTTTAPSTARRRGARWLTGVVAVALGATALAGCAAGGAVGDSPSQITSWMSSSGEGTLIGQVQADSANVALAIRKHDTGSTLKTVCALLSTDALTGVGNLPSPDTTLTDDLNRAFETAATAAQDCYSGATGKASLLDSSTADRAKLRGLFDAAVDRVRALTGRTPSTSTTLAPPDNPDPFGN